MAAYRFLRSLDYERELDAAAASPPPFYPYGEKFPASEWDRTP
jgi:hypothetical protein